MAILQSATGLRPEFEDGSAALPPAVPGASSTQPVASALNEKGDLSHGVWGLTPSDRGLLMLSLAVMTVLLAAHLWRDRERRLAPVEIAHPQNEYQFRVAMNSATWVEWAQLDGIGETLARRIVADRAERGPFESPEDLLRVKGIGRKTVEKLRPFLTVDAATTPAE
jgi:competence protein ComEA